MALRVDISDDERAELSEDRKLVALRSLRGIEWIEEHRIDTFLKMTEATKRAPSGGFQFTAREGGVRTIGVHEIVEIV